MRIGAQNVRLFSAVAVALTVLLCALSAAHSQEVSVVSLERVAPFVNVQDRPLELVGAIGVGAILVMVFTGFWFPKELESAGEGRLPKNFQVGFLFAMMNLIFFAVVLAFVFVLSHAPIFMKLIFASSLDELKVVGDLLKTVTEGDRSNASLIVTGVGVFFGLFGLQRWRRIEAGTLRQLHSISLVDEDERKLADRLKTCKFAPAGADEDRGILALDRLQRRFSPEDADATERSLAEKARKVGALLRLWQDKDQAWPATLARADRPKIDTALHTHQRRMTLVSRVNEYVEKIERGEVDPKELAEIMVALNRGQVTSEDVLARLREMSSSPAAHTVDEQSLQQIVRHLVEFLVDGYNDQLTDLAAATAKAAITSGDDAQKKLDVLKSAGFSGIGRIERIDLHRSVFIVMLIFLFVLFVFFAAPRVLPLLGGRPFEGTRQPFIFVIAITMTIAVVVGTMVGGLRNLANAPNTPWAWYLLAAMATAVAHIVAVLIASVLKLTIAGGNPAYQPVQFAVAGSLVPFFIVLGICLLSRRNTLRGRLPERLADGLWFSLFMLAGGFAFNMVVELAGLPPPRADADFVDRMVLIGFVTAAVGAFIGPTVLHHVRAAALSSIVADDQPADT
jgi:hypothetical protein